LNFSFKKEIPNWPRLVKNGQEWVRNFTSADNYVLQIHNNVPQDDVVSTINLAAVMCIDMVLRSRNFN
jgi:hypothetical protein